MIAPEKLPPVGYGIGEVERILNLPHRTAYRLIREHKLRAFKDRVGRMKVTREELYRYICTLDG